MKSKLHSPLTIVLLLTVTIILACNHADSAHKDSKSQDPCTEAQEAVNNATGFSQSNIYSTAKANIQVAFSKDSLEHAISFGKDANGNNIISPISTGSGHSSELGTVTNMFADIHNHPKGTPPSSGDLYGFISKAAENTLYETRYIVTTSGSVYALVIIDLKIARDFVTKYPKVSNPGYQPAFPDSLVDEFNKLKAFHAATDEMAMAFILEKYNAGVALLKQDEKGNFMRINTKEATDPNGLKIYVAENCQ
jgi:hypothetical protein